jgi:hypothetical protein
MGQFLVLFPSAEKSNSKQRHCRLHRCVDVFSPRLSLIHGKNKLAMMTADEMSKLKKALAIAGGTKPRSFPDSIFGQGCSTERTPARFEYPVF